MLRWLSTVGTCLTIPADNRMVTLEAQQTVTSQKESERAALGTCSYNRPPRLIIFIVHKDIGWQRLWESPPSFPALSGPMLAPPVIIDIQNKDVLIFNWVELSSSAEHFSDLPVGSALLPCSVLLLLPLSSFLRLFISKVIFACSSGDAETTPINVKDQFDRIYGLTFAFKAVYG